MIQATPTPQPESVPSFDAWARREARPTSRRTTALSTAVPCRPNDWTLDTVLLEPWLPKPPLPLPAMPYLLESVDSPPDGGLTSASGQIHVEHLSGTIRFRSVDGLHVSLSPEWPGTPMIELSCKNQRAPVYVVGFNAQVAVVRPPISNDRATRAYDHNILWELGITRGSTFTYASLSVSAISQLRAAGVELYVVDPDSNHYAATVLRATEQEYLRIMDSTVRRAKVLLEIARAGEERRATD